MEKTKQQKILNTKIVAFGLVIVLVLGAGMASALSNSGGGDWDYYREVTIEENAGEDLSDYQVLVELNPSNFPDSANSDGSDIRFSADSDELNYWIEDWDAGAESAKIWVKVPSIPANGEKIIKMWYGNPSATSVSNGKAVFEFFDDFEGSNIDTSIWQHTGVAGGSYTVSGGHLAIYCGGSKCTSAVRTKAAIVQASDNVAIEMYGYETDYGYGNYHMACFSCTAQTSNAAQRPSSHGPTYYRHGIGNFQKDYSPLPFNTYEKRGIIHIGTEGTIFQTELEGGTTYTDQTTNWGTGGIIDFYCYHAKFWIDWVRVRKYADPVEPTTSVGEEQNGVGIPVADAGPDQTVEQDSLDGASVTLDGSGSNDPDGDPLTYSWTWDDGSATGVNPTVSLPLGPTTITLVVNDGTADSDPDTVVIMVQDTTPPVITCPADVTVEQETAAGTVVPLTATATDICDADPTITSDELAIYPLGSTVVAFTATDDSGNAASCTTTVTVEDTTPPEISVTVSPETLWPPNHKMVDITATVTVNDICDAAPTVILTSVTSDEPDNAKGNGDGNTVNDIQGADSGTEDYEFQLRAERAGKGDGRVYTITYTVTDASGNSASASATVVVPLDMG